MFATVILVIAFLVAAFYAGLQSYAVACGGLLRQKIRAIDMACALGTIILLVVLSVRNDEFGVDTPAYLELFRQYCAGYIEESSSASYIGSLLLLDVATLGSCSTSFLLLAWVVVMAGALLCINSSLGMRFRYMFMFLFSIIGFELTTNALRQGFSVALIVTGLSYWSRTRVASCMIMALGALLHGSSMLVLMALACSTLSFGLFLLSGVSVGIFVLLNVDSPSALSLVEPFLYEIAKYMSHEADEIYIRAMAAASLLTVVIAPVMFRGTVSWQKLRSDQEYLVALRLSLTSVPFLYLPYFGYRYIYGIFPIVLWLVCSVGERLGIFRSGFVAFVASTNLLILLAWGYGSAYMRQISLLLL